MRGKDIKSLIPLEDVTVGQRWWMFPAFKRLRQVCYGYRCLPKPHALLGGPFGSDWIMGM